MYHDEMMLNDFLIVLLKPYRNPWFVCKLNCTILFTQSLSEMYSDIWFVLRV